MSSFFSSLSQISHAFILAVDGSMLIDSQTGMKFIRKAPTQFQNNNSNPIQSSIPRNRSISPVTPPHIGHQSYSQNKSEIEENGLHFIPHDYNVQNTDLLTQYSEQLTELSSNNSVKFIELPLPLNTSTSTYYKYIPKNFTKSQQLKQLLIWLAEKEDINQTTLINNDPDLQNALMIARELKREFLKRLRNEDIFVSSYTRPVNTQFKQEQRNPINVANQEKLKNLEDCIQVFQKESEDWKICSGKVYQLHAIAKDDNLTQNDIHLEYDQIDSEDDDFNELLDKKHPSTETNIELSTTQMRQVLNTTNQFVLQTRQRSNYILSALAHQVKESSRIVPIKQDEKAFGDAETMKKESEKKNVLDILRLLSRQRIPKSVLTEDEK
ncbi:uncharacterized protein BX663DRAFT_482366 [Cokeromyces recurvatus]|uniref:uncharacterized protein n=1 Tax=Cokeromyces recurvatus TaxID=90255 RepID=UPI00221FE6CF|nr:uncharacterized protein BX663DRAFT_482366 [Cokeromyces recurvatus]KAI7908150.1 hypothetical protein BX663DRAFT_482366 [Cokeromyces recurvatus]